MWTGKPLPFFRKRPFEVKDLSVSGAGKRKPKIGIDEGLEAEFIALKLAKEGYYHGDPDKVLTAPVTTVLNILHYEGFVTDYERAYTAINSPGAES